MARWLTTFQLKDIDHIICDGCISVKKTTEQMKEFSLKNHRIPAKTQEMFGPLLAGASHSNVLLLYFYAHVHRHIYILCTLGCMTRLVMISSIVIQPFAYGLESWMIWIAQGQCSLPLRKAAPRTARRDCQDKVAFTITFFRSYCQTRIQMNRI